MRHGGNPIGGDATEGCLVGRKAIPPPVSASIPHGGGDNCGSDDPAKQGRAVAKQSRASEGTRARELHDFDSLQGNPKISGAKARERDMAGLRETRPTGGGHSLHLEGTMEEVGGTYSVVNHADSRRNLPI